MKTDRYTPGNLTATADASQNRPVTSASRCVPGDGDLGGARWANGKTRERSAGLTITEQSISNTRSSGETDPTGALSSKTAKSDLSPVDGGVPIWETLRAKLSSGIQAITSNSISSTPTNPLICMKCRQPLHRFVIAGAKLGPRVLLLHPDGTARDEHHEPFPVWTLFGGDGGA